MPNWTKPIHWYVVGPVFKNFYDSPAENCCLGALLLVIAAVSMPLVDIFAGSLFMTILISGGIALWGLTHLIAGIVMIVKKERELERNRKARRRTSQKATSLV